MSGQTIDILRTHRADQLKLSPSSEEFQIVNGLTFFGIFDRVHAEENKDKGNIKQKKLVPVIQVSTIPSGMVERETLIKRADDTTYTLFFVGKNDEGISLLWLY